MYIVLVQEKQYYTTDATVNVLPYLVDACTQEKAIESVQHERKQFESFDHFLAFGSERSREASRPAIEPHKRSGQKL